MPISGGRVSNHEGHTLASSFESPRVSRAALSMRVKSGARGKAATR
jgi:hypothetical protein